MFTGSTSATGKGLVVRAPPQGSSEVWTFAGAARLGVRRLDAALSSPVKGVMERADSIDLIFEIMTPLQGKPSAWM